MDKNYALQIAKLLKDKYPNPHTELIHDGEMQLAIAVVLSAQTTDKKVNQVTSNLFKKYKSWEDLANAKLLDLQNEIREVNFHKGKAQRLIKMSRQILSGFSGELPRTMSALTRLSGIARKSANVILQEAWDISEGIVVDTHVIRVSNRLGLTKNKDPAKIEKDLMIKIPESYWRNFSGAMVLHGRYVCTAKKPKCDKCILNKLCPSAFCF